jgi:hypothetical protein
VIAVMLRYDHRQRGTLVRGILLGGAAACALLSGLFREVPSVLMVVVVVLVVSAYLFSSMTVQVDGEALSWTFGPGMIRKRVPLAEIRRAGVTRTRWYEGWGIHKTARGWLYNVSGFDAVVVLRKDGTQFLLGTDEPARLRDAINCAIGGSS